MGQANDQASTPPMTPAPQTEASWRAATLIADSLRTGQAIDALPAACRPQTRRDGYAIQACLVQASGNTVAGWKIGATSQAGQAHIGVSGPLAGRLFKQHIFREGDVVPSWGNRMKVAEAEFAFVFARDLVDRGSPYTVDDVLAAVGALRPSIELPSSRFADFVTAGEAQLIADNACAGRFVFGAAAGDEWRQIDLAKHPVRATVERAGRVVLERTGSGVAVLGDPRIALTWLVNELLPLGAAIRAGQIVSTGTCMVPLPVEDGDRVQVDFGVLGGVWLVHGGPGAN